MTTLPVGTRLPAYSPDAPPAIPASRTGSGVGARAPRATAVINAGALLVGAALLTTLVFVFQRGWRPLLHANFFLDDMAAVGPRDPFTRGGILHAILGSLIEVG